jgi:hypothetical protein
MIITYTDILTWVAFSLTSWVVFISAICAVIEAAS